MTTLCLCDFVDVAADRERLSASIALASPMTGSFAAVVAAATEPNPLPRIAATHTTQEYLR